MTLVDLDRRTAEEELRRLLQLGPNRFEPDPVVFIETVLCSLNFLAGKADLAGFPRAAVILRAARQDFKRSLDA
jgi:hypothetical protein